MLEVIRSGRVWAVYLCEAADFDCSFSNNFT